MQINIHSKDLLFLKHGNKPFVLDDSVEVPLMLSLKHPKGKNVLTSLNSWIWVCSKLEKTLEEAL